MTSETEKHPVAVTPDMREVNPNRTPSRKHLQIAREAIESSLKKARGLATAYMRGRDPDYDRAARARLEADRLERVNLWLEYLAEEVPPTHQEADEGGA